RPIRKNDHFTLNDFEVINADNVKKYYKEILLCKTCYHTQFEELEIDDPKAEKYYKKEGINKLTECNFCCKPIRKKQGYQLWNTGQYIKNDHFTLNDFEVINADNVKKYYKEILLCKTCYHTQFEELEIDDPKAEKYYKKEGINKLTECNFCCKPIRKKQGYQLWNTGQYITRYGIHASKSINELKIYRLIALIKEEETLLDKEGIPKQYNCKTILLQEKE
ncbi:12120_t:CDS:2, partial [Racocetra persica]